MNGTPLSWKLYRQAVERLGLFPPFPRSGGKRLLFITGRDPLRLAQFFPFRHHRADLAACYGVAIRELPLARFLEGRNPYAGRADAVCFQTDAGCSLEEAAGLAARIRKVFPEARLAYFDGSPASDVRYAEVLDPYLSAYVKNQVLREQRRYREPTLGETNLTDYYACRFRLAAPVVQPDLADGFWDKLMLGTPLAFSPEFLPLFQRGFPGGQRTIDLHARFGVEGADWYSLMREEALDQALALESRYRVAARGRVAPKAYLDELFQSRICFSPFGVGEICRRDFEAIAAGCLLLKPDLSHLACRPELFAPFETYVPLAWDLSDFEEKVAYYLEHEAEREAIARRAFDLLRGYFRQNRFVEDVAPLFSRLGLRSRESAVPRGETPAAAPAAAGGRKPDWKPRVLVSAYQCAPGPEPAADIGWQWYRWLSERTPVTLATHSRNRAALERSGAPFPGSEIVYIEPERCGGPLYRLFLRVSGRNGRSLSPVSWLDFHLYDWALLRTLRRNRKAGADWEVIHQPTPVSPLAATRLHRLGLPLVLGPWNGGLRTAEAFPDIRQTERRSWPLPSFGKVWARWLGTPRKARLVLAATAATRVGLPAACHERCRPMLESGVDLRVFRPEPWPAHPSATEPLRVVVAGPLSPATGVGLLLEAVSRVAARSPVVLTVIGEGPEAETLRAAAHTLEIAGCISFTGALGPAGVATELARAHVFCSPSVRDGSGATVLEAMAVARPVIALDYGAPAEIIDGEVGLLIPATGRRSVVERLTWALIDLMNAPEVWRLRGKSARARVEQHYSWAARADTALQLYREFLS